MSSLPVRSCLPMARGCAPRRIVAGLRPAIVVRATLSQAGQRPANNRHGAQPRAIRLSSDSFLRHSSAVFQAGLLLQLHR